MNQYEETGQNNSLLIHFIEKMFRIKFVASDEYNLIF